MTSLRSRRLAAALALAALLAGGCASHDGVLQPVPPNTDPVVFVDDFGASVDYQAFLGSKVDAVSLDTA